MKSVGTHLDDTRVEVGRSIDSVQVAEEAASVAKWSSIGIATPEWSVLREGEQVSHRGIEITRETQVKLTVVLQLRHLMAPSSGTGGFGVDDPLTVKSAGLNPTGLARGSPSVITGGNEMVLLLE